MTNENNVTIFYLLNKELDAVNKKINFLIEENEELKRRISSLEPYVEAVRNKHKAEEEKIKSSIDFEPLYVGFGFARRGEDW